MDERATFVPSESQEWWPPKVKFFRSDRGFGVITATEPESTDFFVHKSEVLDGQCLALLRS